MAKPSANDTRNADINAGLQEAARLIGLGRYQDAESLLLRIRQLAPLNPYIAYNLGVAWWEQARQDEAIRAWRQALAAKPDFGPAAVNLGNALHVSGQQREALRYCQMAVRLMPKLAGAWHNLTLVLVDVKEAPAALETNDRCLALEPDNLQALSTRIDLLSELKRHEECEVVARKLLSIPGQSGHGGALQAIFANAAKGSRWIEIPQLKQNMISAIVSGDHRISLLGLAWITDDPQLMRTLAASKARHLVPAVKNRPSRRQDQDRITIAYLSPDFREHPVAHMLIDVLQAHDRNRFRILTLGLLPKHSGPLNTRIDSLCDGHIDLSQTEDLAAIERIRSAGVDILVDLAGATQWGRDGILAARPAPVQILWLGCPCTTGSPWYDAFLVDDVVAPPGYDEFCSEPLVRLPCCYHPISVGLATPDTSITRTEVGLPEEAIVLGLLQNSVKISPPLTDMLAGVLRDLPQTVLWLSSEGAAASKRILDYFQDRGIEASRIIFTRYEADRGRYLGRQRLVDLMIDSFPYGGHSTSGEAMAQGVPVITHAGISIHSRVAASMQHRLGLDELTTRSDEEFDALIRRLVINHEERSRIRQLCAEKASLLAADHGRTLVQALEASYVSLLAQAPCA